MCESLVGVVNPATRQNCGNPVIDLGWNGRRDKRPGRNGLRGRYGRIRPMEAAGQLRAR